MAQNIQITKKGEYIGHKDALYTLEKSNASNYFFSAGGDGLLVLWDIHDAEHGNVISKVSNSVFSIKYLKEQNQIIVGQNFEGIYLIDLITKEQVRNAKVTSSYIFDIQVYNQFILLACGTGEVVVLQLDNLKVIHRIKLSEKSARSISIHPQLKEMAVGLSDNTVRIVNLEDFSERNMVEGHKNSVFTVQYSPDGNFLLTAGRDACICIWNCWDHYTLHESIKAHLYAINDIKFSPSGKLFATASMDKTIKIWNTELFKLVKVIDKSRHEGHTSSVNKLLWLDDTRLLSCSDDKVVYLWDIESD